MSSDASKVGLGIGTSDNVFRFHSFARSTYTVAVAKGTKPGEVMDVMEFGLGSHGFFVPNPPAGDISKSKDSNPPPPPPPEPRGG
eukprot:CAMPEP_0196584672 /NCGR_PEP_ID=MMETSP1081-20130531/48058_1 /TAXON_ID=36882 /ORGANISM="Pyramimonas amylifera, Strain CCMP720" /LENGTH=84 /DNA_ID=CAMNT_0041905967 /DNA_START=36 /DNA_END=287 /DNA_ORIENTATION=+